VSLLTLLKPERGPDFVVGGKENPYLLRWWLIPRNRFFNVYLHKFMRSDDDRAEHTHPWAFNASWLLSGEYWEWAHGIPSMRRAGQVKFRWGASQHRIELTNGPCWTLFFTGPVVRQWGFICPQGFVHWRKFTAPHDRGQIGRGCE